MNKTLISVMAATTLLLVGCAGPAETASPPSPPPKPTVTASPSPSATPEPTKPALADLVLSTEGIAPLVIGQAPPVTDPELDILIYDPVVCQADVDAGWIDEPGMWVANYGEARLGRGPSPFGVWIKDGLLYMVQVGSPEVKTAEGIGRMSSGADLLAAYPGTLELMPDDGGDSDVYRLVGQAGNLYFDVLKESSVQYFPEFTEPTVVRVLLEAKGAQHIGFNTDFGLGLCVPA